MANIKINRNELITTLTNRVSTMEAAIAKYEDDLAKVESAQDAWALKALKEVAKNTNLCQDLRASHKYFSRNAMEISFVVSTDAISSERPELPVHPNCSDSQVNEIKQFINFLSLSDDEYVIMNGVLKDLVQYL